VTARVLSLRGIPQGQPCGSGTVKGEISEPCGRRDSRLHAAGWRCPAHPPPSTASLRAFDLFAVPAVLEEAA
jgi:hypothetical protein